MKATVDAAAFADAAAWCARTAGERLSIPALSSVRLQADVGRLEVTAYDTAVCSRAMLKCVPEMGTVHVPAERLADAAKHIGPDLAALEADDKRLVLLGERSRFEIPLVDGSDWPQPPEPEGDPTAACEAEALAEAVRRTAGAARRGGSSYMSSIQLRSSGDAIALVACQDTIVGLDWLPAKLAFEGSALVPVDPLLRIVEQAEGTVEMWLGERVAYFAWDGGSASSRVTASEMPDVNRIVGTLETLASATVDPSEMAAAVAAAKVVASWSKLHPVEVTIGEAEVEVAGVPDTADDGEASSVVAAERLYGEERATRRVSADYLTDALKALKGAEAVRLVMSTRETAGVVLDDPTGEVAHRRLIGAMAR